MRTYFTPLILILVIMVCSKTLLAQNNYFEDYSKKIFDIQYEKVYLHTDRSSYSTKENVWFKIYLFDGKKHLPLIGQNNVYVDLVDQNGEVLLHKIYFIEEGFGEGNIELPASLKTGTYLLHAYTSYMRNFGYQSFFKKTISVSQIRMNETKSAIVLPTNNKNKVTKPNLEISLQFMPEGGYLTSNISNTLAFKVLAGNGKGINLNGVIKNKQGNIVASLACEHLGMGYVIFKPKAGESYYALLNGFSKDTFPLPPSFDKPQLKYLGIKDSVVVFKFSKAPGNNESQYYTAIKSKGKASLFFPLKFKDGNIVLELYKNDFIAGLNQIVLFDKDFRPLAERLFFIPDIVKATLEVKAEKQTYKTREKLNLTINLLNKEDAAIGGNFSLAAINLSELGASNISSENIISYLELSSEIRGDIENAGYYFSKPFSKISEQLDLLLLTQGWTQYIWNDAHIDSFSPLEYKREFGISIEGKANRLVLNKGLDSGKITLLIPKYNILLNTKTDSTGSFCFENFVLLDSTEVTVAGKNKKGRSNVDIIGFDYKVPLPPFFPKKNLVSDSLEQSAYLKNALSRYVNDSYINFDDNTILLNEVSIVQEKTNADDDLMIEGSTSFADDVLQPHELDMKHSDLYRYLQSKIPGLFFTGSEVMLRSRGEEGTPLFMLDGSEVDPLAVKNIPMTMIDKVMVNLSEKSMSIYADSSAALGIIAIYMKEVAAWNIPNPVYNILTKNINGYARTKKFYVPSYESPEISNIPDLRATVYWEPNIVLNDTGSYTLSYYNADNKGKVAIVIQGVLNNGKLGFAQTHYIVR